MGRLDRESDILRDEAGVVIGRRTEHPLAHLFKSVPMGSADLPGMGLLPEMRHLLAIHVFDNLHCSPPRDPAYVYREPKRRPVGVHAGAGGVWVPVTHADDPAFLEDRGSVTVADVRDWTEERLRAQETAIAAERTRQRLVAQADPHITTPAQAGEGATPTPTGEGVSDGRA